MVRHCVWAVLLVGLLAASASAQAEGCLYPDLKVGAVGHFKKEGGYLKFRVVKVIATNAAIVEGRKAPAFIVAGIDTKDLADDEPIELKGGYKVTGTMKYRDRTYKLVGKGKE